MNIYLKGWRRMKLKVITFVLLSGLCILIILGWGKNPGLSELITPAMYWMLFLVIVIAILFVLSVIRYQRLGSPILRLKTCVNNHLLITGTILAISQAIFFSYKYQSNFLLYRLNVGVWIFLALLQIYNFVRSRTICRHGLSGPGITVLWRDIEEVGWENRDVLYIKCKNDLLLFKTKTRLRWTIPRGLRRKIDEVLCEKVVGK